jgi:hypothetical protein
MVSLPLNPNNWLTYFISLITKLFMSLSILYSIPPATSKSTQYTLWRISDCCRFSSALKTDFEFSNLESLNYVVGLEVVFVSESWCVWFQSYNGNNQPRFLFLSYFWTEKYSEKEAHQSS